MKPEFSSRRFKGVPRRYQRGPGASPSGSRDTPSFTLDDLFRDDPTDDEVDEAIDEIASEGCRACPQCGLIVPPEGRRPREATRPPRSRRPGIG